MAAFPTHGLPENEAWMLTGCTFFCNILSGVEHSLTYAAVVHKRIIHIACSTDLCYLLSLPNTDVFCLIQTSTNNKKLKSNNGISSISDVNYIRCLLISIFEYIVI